MSFRCVAAVAKAQLRDLSRRRGSIAILVMLPLVFYWAVGDDPFGVTFAATGMGWAVAIITLFQALSMRAISPRLRLAGFSALDEFVGRVLCSLPFGAVMAVGLWLYVGTDDNVVDRTSLAFAFGFSLLGATALGLASAAIIGREMEATLFLVGVVGLQFPIDPWGTLAQFLPLYGSERFSADAVGWTTADLTGVATRTVAVSVGLIVLSLLITHLREPATSGRRRSSRPGSPMSR